MEWFNQYSGLFAFIAMIAAIVAIFVAVWLANKSGKQMDRMFNYYDEKRKCYSNYDAGIEFQQNVTKHSKK